MHLIKQIAVSVAAFAAATSLVYGAGQQASESFRSKAISGVGQVQRTPVLPTSVGLPAQQSPSDPSIPGTVTQIDFPGASETVATSINPRGEIVGFFNSTGRQEGFLLSNGAFTTIDVPGATYTYAYGINPRGDIVGFYNDSSLVGHGFLLRNGVFTTIDGPHSFQTEASGINRQGDIVGTFADSSSPPHGFLLRNGKFITIDIPGGIDGTEARGIDERGDIVGDFSDGITHGYLLSR